MAHVDCRSLPVVLRTNSFLLCLCSPVLHKMLCGSFIESKSKSLKLRDVDGAAFSKALDIWCGKQSCTGMEMDDVRELASVADRFEMAEVAQALDKTMQSHLDMRICGEVLSWSGELGLRLSEVAARQLATERFEELATTEGFMRMSEEALGSLLEDDNLVARNEEAVWEALAKWRRA